MHFVYSVPASVWRINVDLPPEAKEVSLDNTDDRWWEQVDLTKLILASNALTEISSDIHMLPALTVLDVSVSPQHQIYQPLTVLSRIFGSLGANM